MKYRTCNFVNGALTADHSGHVHAITADGFASAPDRAGAYGYGISGLKLTNGAGQSEYVDYTSWTEAAGVYTFVLNNDLSYAYLNNDLCQHLPVSFLRNSLGAKLVEVYPHGDTLRLKDYTDGDIDVSGCGAAASAATPWDGTFTTRSSASNYVRWRANLTAARSISGVGLSLATYTLYKYSAGSILDIILQKGFFGVSGWYGTKACYSGNPAGTVNKDSGCCPGPSTLEMELNA